LSTFENGYKNQRAARSLKTKNKKLWEEILILTYFLSNALPKQRCWHILNEIYYIPENSRWNQNHYTKYIGRGKSKGTDTIEIRKKSCIEKYGVDNPAKLKETQDKMKASNLEKYGSENYFSSDAGIELVKNEWKNPEKRKTRLDNIKKTFDGKWKGHPSRNKDIMDKIKKHQMETWINNYGCHPMQTPEISERAEHNRISRKQYTMPSGKIISIQGYEWKTIDDLLQSGIHENDIVTEKNKVPHIKYFFNGKIRRYYPDIFVISENKIYETKSTYTYDSHMDQNLAKQQASLDAGYNFEFKIYGQMKVKKGLIE